MNYYVIEISTGDAKIAGKSIYEYAAELDALAAFHSKLGTAMKSELYATQQILVVRQDNVILAMERFVRPVEEAQAE